MYKKLYNIISLSWYSKHFVNITVFTFFNVVFFSMSGNTAVFCKTMPAAASHAIVCSSATNGRRSRPKYYHIVVHQHALAFYICSIYWLLCPNECCCYYQYVLLNWLYHRLGIANCKVLMVDAIFLKFWWHGWFSWCLSNIFTALNTICFFIMVDFSPHFTVQIIRL